MATSSADAFAKLQHRTSALVAQTHASSTDGRRRVVQQESRLPARSAVAEASNKQNLLGRLSRTIFGSNSSNERGAGRRSSVSSSHDGSVSSSHGNGTAAVGVGGVEPAPIHRSRPISRGDGLPPGFDPSTAPDEGDHGQGSSGRSRARDMISNLLPSRFRKGGRDEGDAGVSEAMWEKPSRPGAYSAIAPATGGEGSAPDPATGFVARGGRETDIPPPDPTSRGQATAAHFQDAHGVDRTAHKHARLRRTDGEQLSADSLLGPSSSAAPQPPQTRAGNTGALRSLPQHVADTAHQPTRPSQSLGDVRASRSDSTSDSPQQDEWESEAASERRAESSESRSKAASRHQPVQRASTARQLGERAFALSPGSNADTDSGGVAAESRGGMTPRSEPGGRGSRLSRGATPDRRGGGIEHQYSDQLHPLTAEGWDSSNPLVSPSLAREVQQQAERLEELQREVDDLQAAQAEGTQLLEERLEDLAFAWDHKESLVDGALAERSGRGSSAVAALRHSLRQAVAEEALTQIRREGDSIVAGTAAQLALLESRVKRAENETLLSALADIRGNLVQFLLTGTLTSADTLAPATVPPGLTLYGMFTVLLKQVASRLSPLMNTCGCGRGGASAAVEEDTEEDDALLDFGHAGGVQRKAGGGRRRKTARPRVDSGGRASQGFDEGRDNPGRGTPRRGPMAYPPPDTHRGLEWDAPPAHHGRAGEMGWEPQGAWNDSHLAFERQGFDVAREGHHADRDRYPTERRFQYPGGGQGRVHEYTPRGARSGMYDPSGLHPDEAGSYQGSPPEPLPQWGGVMDGQRHTEGLRGETGVPMARLHHRIRTAPVADARRHMDDDFGEPYGTSGAMGVAGNDDNTSSSRSDRHEGAGVLPHAPFVHDTLGRADQGAGRMRRPPATYGTYPPRMPPHGTAPVAMRRMRAGPLPTTATAGAGVARGGRARREYRAGGIGDVHSVTSADSRAHDFDGIE